MCLAVPGKILEIDPSDSLMRTARVSFGGVVREISLALVPEAEVGAYVLAHAGIGIGVVDEEEARHIFETVRALEALDELEEGGDGEAMDENAVFHGAKALEEKPG